MTPATAGAPARHGPLPLRVWGNPLARGVDRAEAVLIIGLWLTWLLTLPLLATAATVHWTSISTQLTSDRVSYTAVDAVLTEDASPTILADDVFPAGTVAQATWTGLDGRPGSGVIPVEPVARDGDHVTAWLDASGFVAHPLSSVTAAVLTMLATCGAWLALGLALAGVWWAVRRRFDRQRWDEWERDWSSFDQGRKSA